MFIDVPGCLSTIGNAPLAASADPGAIAHGMIAIGVLVLIALATILTEAVREWRSSRGVRRHGYRRVQRIRGISAVVGS